MRKMKRFVWRTHPVYSAELLRELDLPHQRSRPGTAVGYNPYPEEARAKLLKGCHGTLTHSGLWPLGLFDFGRSLAAAGGVQQEGQHMQIKTISNIAQAPCAAHRLRPPAPRRLQNTTVLEPSRLHAFQSRSLVSANPSIEVVLRAKSSRRARRPPCPHHQPPRSRRSFPTPN